QPGAPARCAGLAGVKPYGPGRGGREFAACSLRSSDRMSAGPFGRANRDVAGPHHPRSAGLPRAPDVLLPSRECFEPYLCPFQGLPNVAAIYISPWLIARRDGECTDFVASRLCGGIPRLDSWRGRVPPSPPAIRDIKKPPLH